MLARVGSVLRACIRKEDIVARYGGEEFVVILPNASLEVGCQLGERIGAELRKLDWTDVATDMTVTVSAGVAAGPFSEMRELIEAADRCLYEAKRDGRDRVVTTSSRT